jgi:Zn-dependent M28 family amino/carboxypeptidase
MKKIAIVVSLLIVLAVVGAACVSGMVSMPGKSFEGTPKPPDNALVEEVNADVKRLAGDIGERNLTRKPAALAAAASFIELALKGAGYEVEKQRYDVNGLPVENLIVERKGTKAPTEIVVIGAHYDSAEGTPGADDNASGVAANLALARRFASKNTARTLRFVFFVNEEPPYFREDTMGSVVYANELKKRGENVVAMLSLETIGYFSDQDGSQLYPFPLSLLYPSTGNFIGFVANTESKELVHDVVRVFREHAEVPSEGASVPASIEGVDWSDHLAFWRHGWNALMVTDTAPFRNPHYHEPSDVPDVVDPVRLARTTKGLEAVVQYLGDNWRTSP